MGERTRGRTRQMMLDWMVTDGYGKYKEEVKDREELRRRAFEAA